MHKGRVCFFTCAWVRARACGLVHAIWGNLVDEVAVDVEELGAPVVAHARHGVLVEHLVVQRLPRLGEHEGPALGRPRRRPLASAGVRREGGGRREERQSANHGSEVHDRTNQAIPCTRSVPLKSGKDIY